MAEKNNHMHLVHFLIFFLALLLFFRIIQPLITIFLTSVLITYISFPLYRHLRKYIPNKFFSIMTTLVMITLILLLPFSFLVYELTQQTFELYGSLSLNMEKGTLLGFTCKNGESSICFLINELERFGADNLEKIGFDRYMQRALSQLIDITTYFLVRIPQAILGTGLALFISYFLFRDGEHLLQKLTNWLPFRKKTIEKFIAQFNKITYAIVFAQIFVAIAQGIISMIGFYIFGFPLPIFWGVVTAFFALVPTIGTAMVWAPASLFLIVSGYLSHDYIMALKGIGLAIYGLLVISTVDNILRVRIIHAKAEVHPLIVIAGVIGGVNLFGVIGLFIGPILLSMLITYFRNFHEGFE